VIRIEPPGPSRFWIREASACIRRHHRWEHGPSLLQTGPHRGPRVGRPDGVPSWGEKGRVPDDGACECRPRLLESRIWMPPGAHAESPIDPLVSRNQTLTLVSPSIMSRRRHVNRDCSSVSEVWVRGCWNKSIIPIPMSRDVLPYPPARLCSPVWIPVWFFHTFPSGIPYVLTSEYMFRQVTTCRPQARCILLGGCDEA
jgi:hypothetical protein